MDTNPETETVTPEPIKTIRAKFMVSSVRYDHKAEGERVHLSPVTGISLDGTNENTSFAEATPSGAIELLITNTKTKGFFESGQEFYIDLTKAE